MTHKRTAGIASWLLGASLLIVVVGCGADRPSALDGTGDHFGIPLDDVEWQPQSAVKCGEHRTTYSDTWVGYSTSEYASEAAAKQALCPLPTKEDNGSWGNWTLTEETPASSEEGISVIWATVHSTALAAEWQRSGIATNLGWTCSLNEPEEVAGQRSRINVRLGRAIGSHSFSGEWQGSFRLSSYLTPDITEQEEAVTWRASPAESEALWMDNPHPLTRLFNEGVVLSSDEGNSPILTVTVNNADGQAVQSFKFDLTGWEKVLIPLIAECDEAAGIGTS